MSRHIVMVYSLRASNPKIINSKGTTRAIVGMMEVTVVITVVLVVVACAWLW